ncbi:hypothetical protein [Parasutterella sp.]|uniref:hypothetical protein n=1 Tax=Parasutterella sp. TaxID=2049037 RepID=UPI00352248B4
MNSKNTENNATLRQWQLFILAIEKEVSLEQRLPPAPIQPSSAKKSQNLNTFLESLFWIVHAQE